MRGYKKVDFLLRQDEAGDFQRTGVKLAIKNPFGPRLFMKSKPIFGGTEKELSARRGLSVVR